MQRHTSSSIFLLTISIFILTSCARLPVQNREEALRLLTPEQTAALLGGSSSSFTGSALRDDLPLTSLLQAVASEVEYWSRLVAHPTPSPLIFGPDQFSRKEYLQGLRRFLQLGSNATTPETFYALVAEEFNFYEVYGGPTWGQVFITSYFAPIIEGSRRPTPRFNVPLYQAPEDLVTVNLGLFDPKYGPGKTLKGRLSEHTVIPYYTRDEIDAGKALAGKNLEICWVDAVDAFFLQIQGSGTVHLDSGEKLFINYANQNGHPYAPIGKFLSDKIPLENINLYTLETFLRGLPPAEMQTYFSKNPSYIFFRTADRNAITYLGVPATAGRTIATDRKLFPKGALAFLQFNHPVFASPTDPLPASFTPAGRFVLDQDVGGAIAGGGRVDLFWGQGAESKRAAGVMKSQGKLYYLAPKK